MRDRKQTHEKLLEKMLKIIRENPGIRPSELNRKLGIEHSASLGNTLIKQDLVRKERDGSAVRYYVILKS